MQPLQLITANKVCYHSYSINPASTMCKVLISLNIYKDDEKIDISNEKKKWEKQE